MSFKSTKEIYEALLAGKKIKFFRPRLDFKYVHLIDGFLKDENNNCQPLCFNNPTTWEIYEPPKKKVKLYQYLYRYKECRWKGTEHFYQDDDDFIKNSNTSLAMEWKRNDNNWIEVEE